MVGEKERARREALGRMSSTVVVFVRGVAEADVLLKKGWWLGGTSAKIYFTSDALAPRPDVSDAIPCVPCVPRILT